MNIVTEASIYFQSLIFPLIEWLAGLFPKALMSGQTNWQPGVTDVAEQRKAANTADDADVALWLEQLGFNLNSSQNQ